MDWLVRSVAALSAHTETPSLTLSWEMKVGDDGVTLISQVKPVEAGHEKVFQYVATQEEIAETCTTPPTPHLHSSTSPHHTIYHISGWDMGLHAVF